MSLAGLGRNAEARSESMGRGNVGDPPGIGAIFDFATGRRKSRVEADGVHGARLERVVASVLETGSMGAVRTLAAPVGLPAGPSAAQSAADVKCSSSIRLPQAGLRTVLFHGLGRPGRRNGRRSGSMRRQSASSKVIYMA